MTERQKIYWPLIDAQITRLLSLQDRNPLSSCYGSFDRKYWHQRFVDFSSASLQQGVESLALLYDLAPPNHPFFHNGQLIEWIEASVRFTESIQNRDGSFDEWYVGEHGWAGPTSYILNSLYEAHKRTGHHWSTQTKTQLTNIFYRALPFLTQYEETDVLSNHQALALLTLAQSSEILQDSRPPKSYDLLWQRFLSFFNNHEGWSLEYDGADPGYQTATLSFLARLHRLNSSKEIEDTIEAQLNFLSHFVYPDGSFAHGLGSRSTSNVFFFGLEYWKHQFPIAETMLQQLSLGLLNHKVLRPQDQEDHYFIYRLPEFLLAFEAASTNSSTDSITPLPWQQRQYFKDFKESHHLFYKKNDLYLALWKQRGGAYVAYKASTKELIAEDHGIQVKQNNRPVASHKMDFANSEFNELDSFKIVSSFAKVEQPQFRTWSLLLFKIGFLICKVHPKIGLYLKKLIRWKLMYMRPVKNLKLIRTITIMQDQVDIEDNVLGIKDSDIVIKATQPIHRYVPQSRYFCWSELYTSTQDNLKTPKMTKEKKCVELPVL